MNIKFYLYRRLCPDISFFQQGTDYPCQKIVGASDQQRLHHRVQHTVLRSANVERKGLGMTKVIKLLIKNFHYRFININYLNFYTYLDVESSRYCEQYNIPFILTYFTYLKMY